MEDRTLGTFCIQTALVLKAGIALHEGMAMMVEDIEDEGMKRTLKILENQIEQGETLDFALTTEGSFPQYMISMTEVGIKSGRLEEVMHALGNYYEREALLKESIKSAVFYPLILSCMMLVVMLVLSIKVLPLFEEVFNNLGGELSGIAKHFMQLGLICADSIYAVIGCIILMVVGLLALIKTRQGKKILNRLTVNFKIAQKIAAARFASAMSLMIASGLDTDDALKMALKVVENKKVKAKVELCQSEVERGSAFMAAFEKTEIFSKLATRMLSLGMKTGTMDEMMKRIADSYEEETERVLGKMVAIIEPLLVAVLAIVIGTILIAVMLPLMGIMSSIG